MAVKTVRFEARLSADERARIAQAADVTGQSMSAFMVAAATAHADEVIQAATTTAVPAHYFDDLLAAIDSPESAPRLAVAVRAARENPRIFGR